MSAFSVPILYFWEWKIQKGLVETMDNVNRPLTYKEEVAQYTKKDALHAILFFAAIILYDIAIISVVILFNLPGGLWIAQAFKLIPLTLLFLYLRKGKQGLQLSWDSSNGLEKSSCSGVVSIVRISYV